jgi:hypothetical protein
LQVGVAALGAGFPQRNILALHLFSIYAEAVIKTRINGIANPHKRKREYVETENKNALRRKKKYVATEF